MHSIKIFTIDIETQTKIEGENLDPDDWQEEDSISVRANDAEAAIVAAKKSLIGADRSWKDDEDGTEYSAKVVAIRVLALSSRTVEWDIDIAV